MIFFLGTIIPVLTKQHILYLYLAAMNFLKLCPNFLGSFDWKIFIYQKLSKFCFHLSTHSVNFDLKMIYIFLVCSMIKFSHVFAKKIQFTFMGLWSRKNNKNWKNIHNIKHAKIKNWHDPCHHQMFLWNTPIFTSLLTSLDINFKLNSK